MQLQEWVLTVLAAKVSRWARRVGQDGSLAEVGHDLAGPDIEHFNDLGANQLLACHMKAVGVTPDGVKQLGGRVAPRSPKQRRG